MQKLKLSSKSKNSIKYKISSKTNLQKVARQTIFDDIASKNPISLFLTAPIKSLFKQI
jgi:hypothetical protein